jgi:hypothetical protein
MATSIKQATARLERFKVGLNVALPTLSMLCKLGLAMPVSQHIFIGKRDKILTSTFLCAQAAPTCKLHDAFIILTDKCSHCIKDLEPQCTMSKVVSDKGTGNFCNQCSNKKASTCSLKTHRENLITSAATAMSIELRGILAYAQDLDDVPLIRGITNVIMHTLSLLEEVHPATFKTVRESLKGPFDLASKVLENMANWGKDKGVASPMVGKRATR